MRRRRWTAAQDDVLITEGRLHGYAHAARRLLVGRTPSAARSRIARLRRKSPERVARLERAAVEARLLA